MSARKLSHGTSAAIASSGSPFFDNAESRFSASKNPSCPIAPLRRITSSHTRFAQLGAAANYSRRPIGGALSLALACDFRVMGRSAFLLVPEVNLGTTYGLMTIPRLVRTIGASRAKQLVLFAERLPAELAYEWGLVDRLADDSAAMNEAVTMAAAVASKPRLAVEVLKRAINAVAHVHDEISAHGDMEQVLFCPCLSGYYPHPQHVGCCQAPE